MREGGTLTNLDDAFRCRELARASMGAASVPPRKAVNQKARASLKRKFRLSEQILLTRKTRRGPHTEQRSYTTAVLLLSCNLYTAVLPRSLVVTVACVSRKSWYAASVSIFTVRCAESTKASD